MGEPSDWKSQTTNSITTDREKNNYSLKQRFYFAIGTIVLCTTNNGYISYII